MRYLLLFAALLFSFTYISAQDTTHVVDRVSTTDSKATIGQITMDKKGDFLLIDVYSHGTDTISYSKISNVEYRIDNPIYDSSTVHLDTSASPKIQIDTLAPMHVTNIADGIAQFLVDRTAPPAATYHPERRKAGIGFTFGGIVLMGAGAALIALTPKVPGTSFGRSITPGTAAGFIMAAAGMSMTIPGALIWSRYPHGYSRKK